MELTIIIQIPFRYLVRYWKALPWRLMEWRREQRLWLRETALPPQEAKQEVQNLAVYWRMDIFKQLCSAGQYGSRSYAVCRDSNEADVGFRIRWLDMPSPFILRRLLTIEGLDVDWEYPQSRFRWDWWIKCDILKLEQMRLKHKTWSCFCRNAVRWVTWMQDMLDYTC